MQIHFAIFLFSPLVSSLILFQFDQAAEGARMAGASRIIGVDLNSGRFEEGEPSVSSTIYSATDNFIQHLLLISLSFPVCL